MKRFLSVITLIVSVLWGVCALAGDTVLWNAEDTSPAIRARNNTSTAISIVTSGAGMTNYVISGGFTNSIIDTGTGTNDTITLVSASLLACTNASGDKLFSAVDQYCSLAADSTDGELLDGTNVIQASVWGTALTWDTSACKFWSCYLPAFTRGGGAGPYEIEKVHTYNSGTGNFFLRLYVDQTEKYESLVTSPVYIVGATGSQSYVSSAVVEKEWAWPMPVSSGQSLLIRGSRASTATSGGIGAVLKTR